MILIKDIKQGDHFSESVCGQTYFFEAMTQPYRNDGNTGWEIVGREIDCNRKVVFFAHDEFPAYAPRLELE